MGIFNDSIFDLIFFFSKMAKIPCHQSLVHASLNIVQAKTIGDNEDCAASTVSSDLGLVDVIHPLPHNAVQSQCRRKG